MTFSLAPKGQRLHVNGAAKHNAAAVRAACLRHADHNTAMMKGQCPQAAGQWPSRDAMGSYSSVA